MWDWMDDNDTKGTLFMLGMLAGGVVAVIALYFGGQCPGLF